MEVRASKVERQVVRLHLTAKERDTYRLVMAFAVISYVATNKQHSISICDSNTLYPQHHDSIKQEAQVVPMIHIDLAWKWLDGGIRATTGEHNDPENGNNPVLGSAGREMMLFIGT